VKTIILANGAADPQSYKSFFDRRRALGDPVRLVDVMETPIFEAAHMALRDLPKTRERLERDAYPLPATQDREAYYDDRHLEYWLSGLSDAMTIWRLCPGDGARRYLDFGGCSGRVARHFVGEAGWEPWVCDINVTYADWLRTYAPAIRSFQNRPQPHLPFEDDYFDIVSAFSVFTHLDNDEIQWLLELRRVVKPGGWLFLTVMDEFCWSMAGGEGKDWLVESLGHSGNADALREMIKHPMPADRLILRYHEGDAYNVNTFLSARYIDKEWGKFFSSLSSYPGVHLHQTGILLRK
jgi:SAM-dependent methyltransferase